MSLQKVCTQGPDYPVS